jgi:hypothetical protein
VNALLVFLATLLMRRILRFVLEKNGKTLPDNYRFWTIVEIYYLAFGLVAGSMVVVSRLGFLMLYVVVNFTRLDAPLVPRGFDTFDVGFRSFYAVVVLENRLHNPVMRVFLALLQRERKIGAQAQTRFNSEKTPLLQNDDDDDNDNDFDDKTILTIDNNIEIGHENRKQRQLLIRNRLWLYVFLSRNPSLIKFRKKKRKVI